MSHVDYAQAIAERNVLLGLIHICPYQNNTA